MEYYCSILYYTPKKVSNQGCMLFKPNETSPCIHVSHLNLDSSPIHCSRSTTAIYTFTDCTILIDNIHIDDYTCTAQVCSMWSVWSNTECRSLAPIGEQIISCSISVQFPVRLICKFQVLWSTNSLHKHCPCQQSCRAAKYAGRDGAMEVGRKDTLHAHFRV